MTRHAWTTFVLFTALLGAPALGSDDKNGVSPNTISRPSGPGSLEGLGDAFQPTLNSGMSRYAVGLVLPGGIAGFTPALSLRYDAGEGFGVAGIGWSFGPGCIRRQTDEGLPRYGEAPDGEDIPDRFLGMEGEELVPLVNGYYLAKVEGLFIRYARIGDYWEAHTKSGIKLEFGLTSSARIASQDGTYVYAWCLERQTDTHGNVIEYSYELPVPEDRQIYLSGIRYGPGGGPWTHAYAVQLTYEDRPDPFIDCRSGFRVRTSKRLSQVDVLYDEQLIRRYIFGYEAHAHWSFLTTVTQYDSDGVTSLPMTTFGYQTFDMPDPGTPISASGYVMGAVGEPPQGPDNANVDLIDLNADGLPDLLSTGAGHVAYLNRGRHEDGGDPYILWEGPIDVAAVESRALQFELSSDQVHLADMTGDGISDLVVTNGSDYVEFFANTGQTGWAAGQLMSVESNPPPAPFGAEGSSVLTSDLGFNKRIDVIQSQSGAYFSWFNQGDGYYTGPIVTDAVYEGSQPIEFGDLGVSLADMNGDRLNDVVKITTYSVIWWANSGYGRFGDRVEIMLPDRSLDDSEGGNLHRAKLVDINGDGLSDLTVEQAQGTDLWFWQNLGDGTFATSRVIIDLPVTPDAQVRWADLNGNGTQDLIYADSSLPDSHIQAVDLAELLGGASHYNLLTGIDNGYGRKTAVSYRSTTDYTVDAYDAGHPWSTTVPFPAAIVSQAETTIGLDLDGYADEGPDGDRYATDFSYRDGYYDPIEHQFRGFAFVKQTDHGDERFGGDDAPTLVTRYAFHTGGPDGIDNDGDGETDEEGDLWIGREEEPLKGVQLWVETTSLPDDPLQDGSYADDSLVFERTVTTWQVRDLCKADGGALADQLGASYWTDDTYGRQVRLAVQTVTHRSVIERGSGTAKELESHSDEDALGNPLFEWDYGDLSNSSDDLYTGYEYALNEVAWIMDRASRTIQTDGGPGGAFVSETRNYYDGNAFEGLPLGQMGDRGVLHRTEALISKDAVPSLTERSFAIGDPRDPNGIVDTFRQQVDAYGNPIVLRDANGNDRILQYDDTLHKFPTVETIVVGGGSDDLEFSATYDYRLGRLLTLADLNGHESRFTYDTFGRLTEEFLPGDDPGTPTKTYGYDLGAPVSSITTVAHDNIAGMPDLTTTVFFDGLGRKLGVYDAGGGVMSEVTLYNTRRRPWKVYQPYFGGDGTWSLPPGGVPASTNAYDPVGRVIETVSPPDDDAQTARTAVVYLPLTVMEYDGEDNVTGGIHEDTPKTLVYDGLGRLIEVHEIETLSQVDAGTFITIYRYALPDLLAEIEDSNANVKYMRYDGLGRRIFMNDVDQGHLTYTYDSVGNLISRVDALNQEIVYTYDGVNRVLTEDYLDDAHSLSLHRTPDVAYHYDQPHPDYPLLDNVKGRLSWVEDLTGAQIHGYDQRGHLETVVKRIDQPTGSSEDYMTVSLANNLGQVYRTTYPGGDVVEFTYDTRGFLATVPGFVDQLTYEAGGQKATCLHANGVLTSYTYDPRLRLTHLFAQYSTDVLQDLSYDYDQEANIVGITDGRSLPSDDPRDQTATFGVDNLYRLSQAIGTGYGTIQYDYDRLGNMALKTSPDINDPDVNLGAMSSGGSGGTGGRIGREPSDPPGPHALTLTDNGQEQRALDYDDNGNMTDNNGDLYIYDFADRLRKVIKDDADIRYLYDYTGRRVIKRVDGVQTSYISSACEVRDGKMLKYVSAGGSRLARVDGAISVAGVVSQDIDLSAGWNLISFQVDPGVTDPSTVLASIDGLYAAVYGHDGSDYTYHIPGGGGNTLTELLPNHGYWILMTVPGQLQLQGLVSAVSVNVPADTRVLVGFPGLTAQGIESVLEQYPQIQGLWAYAGAQSGWDVYQSGIPAYVNTLTGTSSGRGYWIVSSEAIALTAPPPGDVRYYHTDHLGSTNVVTDANGELVSEFYSYPFGFPRHEHHAGDVFNPHYQFTGKEQDQESGLHYFEARSYGSVICRFTRADPLLVSDPDPLWPQRLNVYAYAQNRPLTRIDPTGTTDEESDEPPDDDDSDPQVVQDVVAVVEGTIERTPEILQQTAVKAGATAVSKAHELTDPDPAKRAEAATQFATDVAGAAGGVAGETVWEEIDENWSWAVKGPLIGVGSVTAYLLAALDVAALPVPSPTLPIYTGSEGTFTLTPSVNLGAINPEEEQYMPGVGLSATFTHGISTQTMGVTYDPAAGFSGSYGQTFAVGEGLNVGATVTGSRESLQLGVAGSW
ncbi:MAG: VCBS repeat-containing protein [Phycisphaerales bacterium]|nr:MAG: VCBS repeat-containing protein [Phycisphaerales bacterium]